MSYWIVAQVLVHFLDDVRLAYIVEGAFDAQANQCAQILVGRCLIRVPLSDLAPVFSDLGD